MTLRYVPQGPASLSSDAPGWQTSKKDPHQEKESSSDESEHGDSVGHGANEDDEAGVKGPTCWKCKGESFLPLRAQDVAAAAIAVETSGAVAADASASYASSGAPPPSTVGKKKQKRLARKHSINSSSDRDPGPNSVATEGPIPSNQRICPICNGKGYLPVRSRYLKSLKRSSSTSEGNIEEGIGGAITARRRRPEGWKEFGHTPPAVQVVLACDEFHNKGNVDGDIGNQEDTNDSRQKQIRPIRDHFEALKFLAIANGHDDDYETQRKDVPVSFNTKENSLTTTTSYQHQNEQVALDIPSWLPSNPGEQLCNLVGRWRILQRVGSHRWTTDDLVTAYVAASTFIANYKECPLLAANESTHDINSGKNSPTSVRYLDLGTGNASVLQMVSWYLLSSSSTSPSSVASEISKKLLPPLEAVGVEARSEAVGLARRSLAFNLGSTEYDGKLYTSCGSCKTDSMDIAESKVADGTAEDHTMEETKIKNEVLEHNVQVVQGDFRDLVYLSSLDQNTKEDPNINANWSLESVASKRYDLITGTPPYFRVDFSIDALDDDSSRDKTTEHKDKKHEMITTAVIQQGGMPTSMQSAPARCEFRGGVEAYCEAAAALLSQPNGLFVVCENWLNDNRVWKGAHEAGLEIECVWPVIGRAGKKDPLFSVYVMKKTSKCQRGELNIDNTSRTGKIRPPLVVRTENGKWSDEYAKVMKAMSIPVV
ncbi:hypothetical protein ACHAXS_008189 [Conticribra weissflogii]